MSPQVLKTSEIMVFTSWSLAPQSELISGTPRKCLASWDRLSPDAGTQWAFPKNPTYNSLDPYRKTTESSQNDELGIDMGSGKTERAVSELVSTMSFPIS